MNLTSEQSAFVDRVLIGGIGSIVLSSAGGCGKSFVIEHIARLLRDKKRKAVIMAPTNKAKDVLIKNGIPEVKTIHSFLRSKKVVDEDGKQTYELSKPDIKGFDLFIDECSMINDSMFAIFELLSKDNFIIYVGDHHQLPPIVENDKSVRSKVFDSGYESFAFTKNMRSKKLSSTVMLEMARRHAEKGCMPPSINSMNMEEILPYFDDDGDSIIICYTNLKVKHYNQKVRSYLFCADESKLEPFYIGETLVFKGWRYTNGQAYTSGSTIKISQLLKVDIPMNYQECDCNKTTDMARKLCRKHKFRFGEVKLTFHLIVATDGSEWFIPRESTIKEFNLLADQYHAWCKLQKSKLKWEEYLAWKDKYNSDLRYRYASTFHSSQGSQWQNVFVDRLNLVRCCKDDLLLKVCGYYTGISRHIKEVYDIEYQDN